MHSPEEIRFKLIEIWHQIMGEKPLGAGENFFDSGLRSMSAMQLYDRLEECYRLRITIEDLVNHPTVDELAAFLADGERNDGSLGR